MGNVWKCCVFAVVLCDLSSFGLDFPSEPVPGFQFNCGQDLCTFPHQYCDTDDYRCLYCSDDLCHTKDLPDQCRSYCKDIQKQSTPITTQGTLRNLTKNYMKETMQESVTVLLLSILITLLLILFLIIGLAICLCRTMRNKMRSNRSFITTPTDETGHHTPCSMKCECEQKALLPKEKIESSDSGNSSQPSFASSLSSNKFSSSSVTHPEEVGCSRQHEPLIEHELLKNSFPESVTEESDTGLTSRDTSGNTTVRPPSSDFFPSLLPDTLSSSADDTCLKSNS